jgi:periplasmic divalent cation tolerance protein
MNTSDAQNTQYCLVYSTCPKDNNHSEYISNQLVSNKLAACVNIVDNIKSIYTWDGKVETSQEQLLIIKTRTDLLPEVKAKILELHPYDCPEIIASPITAGNPDFLSWIDSCLLA